MNSKRQTIWLVSMLSLMVVLSAYYLFTEDAGTKGLADTAQTQAGAAEVSQTDGIEVQQVTGDGALDAEAAAEAAEAAESAESAETGKDAAGADKETAADGGLSPEDQAVLQQYESSGSSSQFTELGLRSQERVNAEYDKIMQKISDVKSDSETSAKAVTELEGFEERQSKLTELRGQLEKEFKNVVIDENGDAVKVVVQSQKLERSQAAAIISTVSAALDVNAGDVLVQYLP
ncbi:SpoIIIAH-like family protein [Paenibacillus pasadenensis]|uniref:SpoIIIAH-like family protein n=1 Tax=Paenibacillus pasadenensis TaxID=217090 RepID=UPI000423BDC6|nr:SpoIIIAH-like family protein [Paenibacillus pasadenensis]